MLLPSAHSSIPCCITMIKSASAKAERFWPRRKFEKWRNTVCIFRFSNGTYGAGFFGVTGIYLSQPAADVLTILVYLCSVKSMKATASQIWLRRKQAKRKYKIREIYKGPAPIRGWMARGLWFLQNSRKFYKKTHGLLWLYKFHVIQ